MFCIPSQGYNGDREDERMAYIWIRTENHSDKIKIEPGNSVAEALRKAGYALQYACGGNGTCGKCKVLTDGKWKKSCCIYPTEDITITAFGWDEAQPGQIVGVCCTKQKTDTTDAIMAVDVGTTTLAAALVDRESGEVLMTRSKGNSQAVYGADVISRMHASTDGHKEDLQKRIRQDMKEFLSDFKKEYTGHIGRIYLSGNTTMEHLFMGDSCEKLGQAPFEPVSLAERESVLSDVPVTLLPGISAFVGADIAAGLLECGMAESDKPILFLDIGTNGEMALGNKDGIITTSAPAGPAFEGGNIGCGVGSIEGAVCKVRMVKDRTFVQTINGKPAVGLCGTGVLETVAELLDNRWIDKTGAMDARFQKDGFLLTKRADGTPICFTQQDVREVQMAKAAIRSGIELMMRRMGITTDEIDAVYLAGGFGYYLDVAKAVRIGLLPKELKSRTQAVGNTSLKGCITYARMPKARERMQKILSLSQEINLAAEEDFEDCYMRYMNFE